MVQRTILIAVFMVMTFAASPAGALLVSARPAWNGWVRADMPTEVEIRVVADPGGLLTLSLSDRSVSYTHKMSLEPGVEFVWRVPLSPPSGAPLQLRVQLDEEPAIEQEIILRRQLTGSPLVAVLSDQPTPLDGIEASIIYLSSNSLPFHSSSFAAMDLILIHSDSLIGMERQQLTALRQHAAQCGRIVIIGWPPAAMDKFAGCGGRFLLAVETEINLNTRVASLLAVPVPQLPSAASLHALLDKNGLAHQTRPIIVFFTIYLCVLLITLRSRRAPTYFVAAATAATLIGLIAWSMNPEYVVRVAWTEMENRDGVARFASILRVLGSGGTVTIDTPVDSGPLQALQPMNLMLVSDQDGSDTSQVSFDTLLFSKHEFITIGVTIMPAPVIVKHAAAMPRIINTGTGKSPPALLAWNDRKYSVPALTPNTDWRPENEPEPWGTAHAEQLFRQRAMSDSTALLFEYPSSSLQQTDAAHIYLMVRP